MLAQIIVGAVGVMVIAFGSLVLFFVMSGPIYDRDEECARATGVPMNPGTTEYSAGRVARFPVDWVCIETSTGRTGHVYGTDSTWLPIGIAAGGAALVVTTVAMGVRGRRGRAVRRRSPNEPSCEQG
jgi:hypothetical protein